MIFVVDLDDTVCLTAEYSLNYIVNFIKKNNLPYKQISSNARFAEKNFDWSMEEALAWYKEYGDQMMAEFPCVDYAVEFLQAIHNKNSKTVIATARTTDWHTDPEKITKNWLSENKIPYDKIYFGRADKQQICEEVGADCFIDDDVNIVKKVVDHFASIKRPIKVFLMTSEFNKELECPNGAIRVQSFKDIAKALNIDLEQSRNLN